VFSRSDDCFFGIMQRFIHEPGLAARVHNGAKPSQASITPPTCFETFPPWPFTKKPDTRNIPGTIHFHPPLLITSNTTPASP
jgi:hypothetical protein